MPITINGSGTVTGVSVGGLPDGIVDADMLASNSVQTAKIVDNAVVDSKVTLSGAAKAWVWYNGSTQAILDSFGVSGMTRHSAGQYTVTFSTAFSSAYYCPANCPPFFNPGNDNWEIQGYNPGTTSQVAGSCRFWMNQGTSTFDNNTFGVVFFGDQ